MAQAGSELGLSWKSLSTDQYHWESCVPELVDSWLDLWQGDATILLRFTAYYNSPNWRGCYKIGSCIRGPESPKHRGISHCERRSWPQFVNREVEKYYRGVWTARETKGEEGFEVGWDRERLWEERTKGSLQQLWSKSHSAGMSSLQYVRRALDRMQRQLA